MPLFDRNTPPPRRTLWDKVLYGLCAILIWAAALWQILTG